MAAAREQIVVVTGATGRQGRSVTTALLQEGWHVRALTRNPSKTKAQGLSALGAELVQGDMDDRRSLETVFQGAYGVFSVQNPMTSSPEAEVRQGKWVAEVARDAHVQHLVYGSAGIGQVTGIGSWDSKLDIEAHMKALGIPWTILRPMAFMDLMTDKTFYPAVSTWHIMPKLMGAARPVAWLASSDIGIIAAKVFADPKRFVGQDIKLASDVKTMDECRAIYRKVLGKNPPHFPMPLWLFKRIVGTDLMTMWTWLRTAEIDLDTEPTRAIHPGAMRVDMWLRDHGR